MSLPHSFRFIASLKGGSVTTTTARVTTQENKPPTSIFVYLQILWSLLISVGCIYASVSIFEMDEFYNLGDPVQYFTGLIVWIPVFLSLFGAYKMLKRNNDGRYAAMILNVSGMVFGFAYLLHLWGIFEGLDSVTPALIENLRWAWGIAIGYAIFWVAGRLDEDSQLHDILEKMGLAISMLALMGLLLVSGLLDGFGSILSNYDQPLTWIVTALVMIFAGLAWRMIQMGAYFGESTGQREAWQGWLMLAPNMFGFLIFFAGPLLLSFYLSFTDAQVGQVPEVIGLGNYWDLIQLSIHTLDEGQTPITVMPDGFRELTQANIGGTNFLIGASDPLFWISLRNTLYFCLLLVPLSSLPALFLAIILNSKIPGMKFYRAVYFLPSVAAVVGTALIWRWLYDPIVGYYNYFLAEGARLIGANPPSVEWLSDRSTALPAVVLLVAWQVTGFNTVLFLAGLQGIPNILYEAARIDGANRLQQFRHVTLPMLAPTTFFVVITTVIQGLQIFNEIFAMFPARPIPEHVMTSVYYLYDQGFFRFQFGYASAVAWLLFGLIFSVTMLQFRLSRSSAYED